MIVTRPLLSFTLTSRGLSALDPEGLGSYQTFEQPTFGPLSAEEPARFDLLDAQALREAILGCRQALGHGSKRTRARLALDGGLLRQLHLPLAYEPETDELRTAVLTELERYTIFQGTEVLFDCAVLSQENNALGLLVTAFRRDLIEAIREAFSSSGVELLNIEPAAIALQRASFRASGSHGVILALPHSLDIAVWHEERLGSWRRVYVDLEAIARRDGEALADARMELQRSLLDTGVKTWKLINVPESLEDQMRMWPGLEFEHLDDRKEAALARGAADFGSDEFPLNLNVLPIAKAKKRSLSNMQLALIGAFSGILLVILLVSVLLDGQLRTVRAAMTRIQTDTTLMQSALTEHRDEDLDATAARALLKNTQAGGSLFRSLQDVTPGDAWMTESQIDPDRRLTIRGYALSRSSPLDLARALGDLPMLTKVGMPTLDVQQLENQQVFRFEIVAEVRP